MYQSLKLRRNTNRIKSMNIMQENLIFSEEVHVTKRAGQFSVSEAEYLSYYDCILTISICDGYSCHIISQCNN